MTRKCEQPPHCDASTEELERKNMKNEDERRDHDSNVDIGLPDGEISNLLRYRYSITPFWEAN